MLVNVVFTFNYDVVDVPKDIAKDLKKYQLQCDKWLFNKKNNHEFWIERGSNKKYAVNTCSEAFVYYLNTFVLSNTSGLASIVESDKDLDLLDESMPTIYY